MYLPASEGVQDPGPSERVDQTSSRFSCYVEGGVTIVPHKLCCSIRHACGCCTCVSLSLCFTDMD